MVTRIIIIEMLSIGNCESIAVLQWSCNPYDCVMYVIIQTLLCYIYIYIWYNKENTKTNWHNTTNMNIPEWEQRSQRKQPKKHTKSDQKILKKIPDIKKDPKKIFQLLKFR